MGGYVLLTVWLRQRGSPESNPIEDEGPDEGPDDDPATHRDDPKAPWPVRRGGVVAGVYSHSLSIAFLALFTMSFLLHAWTGSRSASAEAVAHGGQPIHFGQYLMSAQMWFESLQNWQSEFLAVAAIVVLSIWFREKGSAESKPVQAPHRETGTG
jgi:hypothetical protein